jgi:hypothetical protein
MSRIAADTAEHRDQLGKQTTGPSPNLEIEQEYAEET